MRICSLVCALFLAFPVAAAAGAATGTLDAFVLERNGTREDAARLQGGNDTVDTCLATPSHLICVQARNIPNSRNNHTVQQAALKIQAHQVKHRLYGYCFAFLKNMQLQNNAAALATYIKGLDGNMPEFVLKGLETASYADGDRITTVASVPHVQSLRNMEKTVQTRAFSEKYCENLFPEAKKQYLAGNYGAALVILKELHDLQWANAEAYILASHAFLKTGNTDDALKIAGEVLSLLAPQLTPELAERLGDIFLECGRDREAQQAFNIALESYNNP